MSFIDARLVRDTLDVPAITDVTIEEPDLESIIRRIYIEGYDDPLLEHTR